MKPDQQVRFTVSADIAEFQAQMAKANASLNECFRRIARDRAIHDEARALVLARLSLPRGFKWLIGFPRVLGLAYRLRVFKRPTLTVRLP